MAIDATVAADVLIVTVNGFTPQTASVRVNDTGFPIELTVKKGVEAVDISGIALPNALHLVPPKGQSKQRTPTFKTDGVDGIVKYVVQAGDFDSVGLWRVRMCLTEGSLQLMTSRFNLDVERL